MRAIYYVVVNRNAVVRAAQLENELAESRISIMLSQLQPLVENAVRHGVTKKKGGGTVTISTRETASAYLVTVHDTGNGFDPEHYTDDGKVHIGIRNVRERLERMVGGTLTIESTPETGTTATILIPKKEGMLI